MKSHDDDLWALWPDDYMCPLDTVSEHTHRSDDYQVVRVEEYLADGYPLYWEPVTR